MHRTAGRLRRTFFRRCMLALGSAKAGSDSLISIWDPRTRQDGSDDGDGALFCLPPQSCRVDHLSPSCTCISRTSIFLVFLLVALSRSHLLLSTTSSRIASQRHSATFVLLQHVVLAGAKRTGSELQCYFHRPSPARARRPKCDRNDPSWFP